MDSKFDVFFGATRFPSDFQDFNAPRVAVFVFSVVGLARGLGSHPAAAAADGPFARAEAGFV